jgi:3-hydroxyacyl-CoA dehydrogenase
MKRIIKKVAVLGSGVMGSRIACHFANAGVEVLLLDISPKELNDIEKAKGLTIDNKVVKNRIVNDALQATYKANPAALYHKKFDDRISIGNFEDDLSKIKDVDWILEAVVENLDIKKSLFEKVEAFRKQGSIITSNTSGIPIHFMLEGRSEDFQTNFCGSHFFNPPRYLKLLEIIPTQKTSQDVVDFLMHYGDLHLGKTTVLCKDTPAFIANRIGVYGIMQTFAVMQKLGLSVDEVDALTGPIAGRPKSATFRTCDVVGLDTLAKVSVGLQQACPNDEQVSIFNLPDYVKKMVEQKWIGDKAGQGFYKKTKNEKGKTEILTLDVPSLEYKPKIKSKFATLEAAKPIENLKERIKILVSGKDKAADFYRETLFGTFAYASNRIPEIADHLYQIDDAMKAGFGWDLGPFEIWDAIGVEAVLQQMNALGFKAADWVNEMIASGVKSFYSTENNSKTCYEIPSKNQQIIKSINGFVILENFNEKIVWKNSGCLLKHIGDGVLNLEFTTKMNSIGGEVLEGVMKSIDVAEKEYNGLIIGNDGANFSAGANVAMMFMLAMEQEYDELDMAVRMFQNASMRIRYSSIPVVVAPHGLTLGGGCEFTMHSDKAVASAESYIGLVEVGVGIIPAGGGTKEFALRASDSYFEGDVQLPTLQKRFTDIAMAKVSTSAHESFDLGVLRKGHDVVVMNQNRLLAEAKSSVLKMVEEGYVQPKQRNDIKVLGRSALGALLSGISAMQFGGYISEHDKLIAQKLAYAICGGDLTSATLVTEQYLLDLERETFLSLVTTKKSLERLQSILTTGKPLRN